MISAIHYLILAGLVYHLISKLCIDSITASTQAWNRMKSIKRLREHLNTHVHLHFMKVRV